MAERLKELFKMIALLGFLGALAAFVGILSALSVIILIINAIAGLSMWGAFAMFALGFKPDMLTVFASGVVLAVILIICGNVWPKRTDRFFEVIGIFFTIIASVIMLFAIIASLVTAAGIPGFLVLHYFMGKEPPFLLMPVFGIATVAAYYAWKNQAKPGSIPSPPAQNR